MDGDWIDPALGEQWAELRALRERVNAEIEPKRRAKEIGSSLAADVTIGFPDDGDRPDATTAELAELFIVADVGLATTAHGPHVIVHPTAYAKCGRCWRHLPDVAEEGALCRRCDEVAGG